MNDDDSFPLQLAAFVTIVLLAEAALLLGYSVWAWLS